MEWVFIYKVNKFTQVIIYEAKDGNLEGLCLALSLVNKRLLCESNVITWGRVVFPVCCFVSWNTKGSSFFYTPSFQEHRAQVQFSIGKYLLPNVGIICYYNSKIMIVIVKLVWNQKNELETKDSHICIYLPTFCCKAKGFLLNLMIKMFFLVETTQEVCCLGCSSLGSWSNNKETWQQALSMKSRRFLHLLCSLPCFIT